MEELRYRDTVEIKRGFFRGFKGIVTDCEPEEELYKVDGFFSFTKWFTKDNLKKVLK